MGGDYTSNLKDKLKVLDFIKSGGPEWTVDRTTFEMWLGNPCATEAHRLGNIEAGVPGART